MTFDEAAAEIIKNRHMQLFAKREHWKHTMVRMSELGQWSFAQQGGKEQEVNYATVDEAYSGNDWVVGGFDELFPKQTSAA